MDIRFYIRRNIVIDDVTDALHIQPARCHISSDNNIEFAVLKILYGLLTLLLRDIPIQSCHGVTTRRQFVCQLSSQYSGAHKDQHPVKIFHLQNTGQRIELMHARHHPDPLAN